MIKKIQLPNKPLCMCKHNNKIYIGDAHGQVLMIEQPYLHPKILLTLPAPVSSIVFISDIIYFGTWDGEVYSFSDNLLKNIKLGKNPVKCMIVFDQKIFVSVDTKLIVLGKDLNILEKYDTEYKISCMDVHKDTVIFGLMTGMISKYNNGYISGYKSKHDTNILSIYKNLTGSSDNTLRNELNILFSGSGWIRSIFDENLFSSGKDVILERNILYSHEDEVMQVLKIDNKIISIGLDYSYIIFSKDTLISEEEENEILDLINN